MTEKDWYSVLKTESCEDKVRLLMMDLTSAIDSFLPRKIVKKHPIDRPWISKKLKSRIRKRQSAFPRHGKNSPNYKFWRNKVQGEVKKAKNHYYHDKVAQVESTNSSKWWRHIKSLTGQDIQQEWYYQFLEDTMNTKLLANKINDFFASLADHLTPLTRDSPSSLVPQEIFVSNEEVFRSLSSLNVAKAVGPDNIPNKLFKDFAHELAPVIRNIHNQSLRERYIPSLLKSSVVTPIPKVNPPISLTCTLAKVMEGFTCNKLLLQLHGKIDLRQFARRGHSTTDALLFMLRAIYEAVDYADLGARVFFTDLSKSFDLIDQYILITELRKLEVDPALISRIAAFLIDRQQAVRIGAILSDWKFLEGGVPLGTKLGVILFTIMINNLLADWHLRVKFVDDTSAMEILPRNSISLLNSIVFDIHKFSMDHNMRLNPIKCKEMSINFMLCPNFTLRPLVVGNNCIERVSTYKILGVFIDKRP